jgi:hypothetical protein
MILCEDERLDAPKRKPEGPILKGGFVPSPTLKFDVDDSRPRIIRPNLKTIG